MNARECGLLGLVVVSACAPAVAPRPLFPPPVAETADALHAAAIPADRAVAMLGRARDYERATGDFSAQIQVAVRDLGRAQSFSAGGAIAVRRPDAMRMQMSGPGGVTAVDLLSLHGGYQLRIVGRPWVRGALSDPPAAGFPASTIARVFLGFDWDHAALVAEGPLAIARVDAPGGPALVTFDARDGATREVRWFVGDGERERVRFAEFDTESTGIRFPRVVLFWQHDPDVTATITVQHRTLSPTLPAATFAAPTE